jgi:hypothetical protein
MGNPNPRKEFLIPIKRSDKSKEPLAERNVTVRLFRDVDMLVQALPNRSAWLRRVITEAAQRELMKDGET